MTSSQKSPLRVKCAPPLQFMPTAATVLSSTANHCSPESGNIIQDSFAIGTVCYAVLGILTLPLLARFRWSTRQFVKAAPFAVSWYLSQVALFVCFGLLGTVFGNVIQASRGLISIALGILLLHYGFGRLDARISRAMWLRRAAAAILMAAGIILYSLAKL